MEHRSDVIEGCQHGRRVVCTRVSADIFCTATKYAVCVPTGQRRVGFVGSAFSARLHSLGERGQLTGGYMLITLWFFKQFVHTFPRGDMLITF